MSSETSEIDYVLLENLKNGRFISGKYESMKTKFDQRPRMVIFCNHHLHYKKLMQSRWKVHIVHGGEDYENIWVEEIIMDDALYHRCPVAN